MIREMLIMNASEQDLLTDLSRIYCFPPPISIYRRNLVKISWTSLAAYSKKHKAMMIAKNNVLLAHVVKETESKKS